MPSIRKRPRRAGDPGGLAVATSNSDRVQGEPNPAPRADFDSWSPEQIGAWREAQQLRGNENGQDRTLVFRQMHIALALMLGGAIIATVGVIVVSESDATKLTAIISLATAVIGAGAALLPTGAAAGAAARILSRPVIEEQGAATVPGPFEQPPTGVVRTGRSRPLRG
jgi:hypothetical protein